MTLASIINAAFNDSYVNTSNSAIADIVVAKHRSGPTGIVNLQWKRESMRFTNHDGGIDPNIVSGF